MEFEHEEERKHEQELKNLQVLEWLHDLPADPKKTILKIEDVDQSSIKYISHDNTESNWIAPYCPLPFPNPTSVPSFGESDTTERSRNRLTR